MFTEYKRNLFVSWFYTHAYCPIDSCK